MAARRRRASTTSRWSARCGRPTTTTARSSSSTPAGTALDGLFPTIGSWVHYGLGSLNDNLPQFVVLGNPIADCCGGMNGARLQLPRPRARRRPTRRRPRRTRCPSPRPAAASTARSRRGSSTLLQEAERRLRRRVPRRRGAAGPHQELTSSRSACRRPSPRCCNWTRRTRPPAKLYGLDQDATRTFGRQCLAARRLVERGVRFVQVFHGSNGGAGAWDAHSNLKAGHSALCRQVDQPIAGLIHDLKQRGMLDETLVVWGTEFGRTPGAEGADGRDHHPLRLQRLARRRRHQGRRRPRRHRRAWLPRGREPALRHRPARHRPATAGLGLPPAGGSGPQAPGDRVR